MTDLLISENTAKAGRSTPGKATGFLRLPRALRGDGRLLYPAIDTVLAEWDRLRDQRIAPARSEIDPARLAPVLEYMFIAEIIAPGVARLRLAGQSIYALLGMEPRGMPLCCLMHPGGRQEMAQAVRQVGRGVRVRLPLRAARGLGRPGLDGMMLLLPLTDQQGQLNRVLGVLETHGQPGRTPRRFDLAGALQSIPQAAPLSSPALSGHDRPTPLSADAPVKPSSALPGSFPAGGSPAGAVTAVPGRAGWQVIIGGRS
ncbi:MAG: PAS domain-containing protein [Pararhodobacter sp.]